MSPCGRLRLAGVLLLAGPGVAGLAGSLGRGVEPLVVAVVVVSWLAGFLLAAEGFRGLGVRPGFVGALLALLSVVAGGLVSAAVASLLFSAGQSSVVNATPGQAPAVAGAPVAGGGVAAAGLVAAGLASIAMWFLGVLGVALGVWRLGGVAARLAAVGALLVLVSMLSRPLAAGELLLLALLGAGLLLARCPIPERGGEEPGGPGGAEAEAPGGLGVPGEGLG